MKRLPEVYNSVMEMIEGTAPRAHLSSCQYFGVPGHNVQSRLPEYMGGVCFCLNAECYRMFTFSEATSQ